MTRFRRVIISVALSLALPASTSAAPIHVAVKAGDSAEVARLIAAGVNVDEVDYLSGSALHIAAVRDLPEIAASLITAGANVDVREDASNATPLHWAALGGSEQVTVLLLEAGAEIDPRKDGDATPLHEALQHGHKSVALLLVEHGADLSALTDTYLSPLQLSGMAGFFDLVDVMIARGAGPDDPPDIKLLLKLADPVRGGELFAANCVPCHAFPQSKKNDTGPTLWNVVGRKIGSIENFDYSLALRRLEGAWDYDQVNKIIADSTGYFPGTNMYYRQPRPMQMPDSQERADVISFLRLQSDTPVPLP